MTRAALLAFCGLAGDGCAVSDTIGGYLDSPGTVYICEWRNPDGSQVEFCYDGPAQDLIDYWHIECRASGLFDRTSLVGCWYHCDDPATTDFNEGAGAGANAHNGSWCPEDGAP